MRPIFLGFLVIFATGCQPSEPTYDQALQTWKTEIEVHDRMVDHKSFVIKEANEEIAASHDMLKKWNDQFNSDVKFLENAGQLSDDTRLLRIKHDHKELEMRKKVDELSGAIKANLEKSLTEIDGEIKRQLAKVDKAKAILDAAEKRRK